MLYQCCEIAVLDVLLLLVLRLPVYETAHCVDRSPVTHTPVKRPARSGG